MTAAVLPWIADAFVILGVVTMSVAVYGLLSISDLYGRLHSTGKAIPLGVIPLLIAITVSGDPDIIGRVIVIGVLLVITTPVSAHALAYAIYHETREEETDTFDTPGTEPASHNHQTVPEP